MDLLLDGEEQAFRRQIRAFLDTALTDDMTSGQFNTSGVYPEPEISGAWQRVLNEKGWLVPMWPREWGGTEWSGRQRFLFEVESALAGAPLVHPMGVRLVGPVILKFGTEEQKAHYLPRILDGTDYWCQGFSEPGAGSDLASLKMRADRDGENYVLNGSKIWTTHAHHANRMFALVRTSNEGKRQQGITFLLVDMNSPGIEVRPIDTIGGDHDVNEVFFTDVVVPVENRVGAEGEGWDCAKYLLEFERGAGIFSGRLRSQLKRIASILRGGVNDELHACLSGHQAARFAEVCAELDCFEMLELRVIGNLRPGESPGSISSVLKLKASRLKQNIAELGFELLGDRALYSAGSDSDSVLVADFLNSRAFTIFGGAAEVQLSIIAKSVMS